ncbi:uncharacterized protein LOC116401411 [Anarrhichthys ocellatus]|uniref:uncharacterized protein LOC116401411 n=1 Tax=Anarrhichthys ocellatus TaxID=433405 RepID=UPI0012ED2B74|nr:uncharacterized protein LOC116401411 [Anarrhichthys ocellatus]
MKFKWEVVTVKDLCIFLSVIISTGLVTVHHRSDYLHLSDPEENEENEKIRNSAEYYRLFKMKLLYTEMVNACKAHFQAYQNVSIDERMVATIKDTPTKWGYKLFVLADSSIAYTWSFFVYAGMEPPLSSPPAVLKDGERDPDSADKRTQEGQASKPKPRRPPRFQNAWLKRFWFLCYSPTLDLMWCHICRLHSDRSHSTKGLIKGSRMFKLQNIHKHSSSNHHKNNESRHKMMGGHLQP